MIDIDYRERLSAVQDLLMKGHMMPTSAAARLFDINYKRSTDENLTADIIFSFSEHKKFKNTTEFMKHYNYYGSDWDEFTVQGQNDSRVVDGHRFRFDQHLIRLIRKDDRQGILKLCVENIFEESPLKISAAA